MHVSSYSLAPVVVAQKSAVVQPHAKLQLCDGMLARLNGNVPSPEISFGWAVIPTWRGITFFKCRALEDIDCSICRIYCYKRKICTLQKPKHGTGKLSPTSSYLT